MTTAAWFALDMLRRAHVNFENDASTLIAIELSDIIA